MPTKIKFIFISVWVLTCVCSPEISFADGNKNNNIIIIFKQGYSLHEEAVFEIINKVKVTAEVNANFSYVYSDDLTEVDLLKNKNIDLAISIGVDPAKAILASKPDYPVLYTLIPKQTLDALFVKYQTDVTKMNVIYLTQSLSRKLLLSKIILNKPGRVGVTLSSRQSVFNDELLRQAKKLKIELKVKYAVNYKKPVAAMKAALSESDIYLVLYDSGILNKHTAKWLLYMAYKKSKPVIGFSSGYTRAGAVVSLFSTPSQIGRQTADWLINYLSNKNIKKIQFPIYFTVSVNKRIQRILRLKDLDSDEINYLIQEMEGGTSDD